MQAFYHRLLAMGPGGEEARGRVHFITPEQVGKFPRHHMSLSTVLMYSTRTLERLRHLTAGREAYIVPNVVSRDDLAVADMLGGLQTLSITVSTCTYCSTCLQHHTHIHIHSLTHTHTHTHTHTPHRPSSAGRRARDLPTLLLQGRSEEDLRRCGCVCPAECQ